MNDIRIGAADYKNSLTISHVISYMTPFRAKGNAVNVVIGLSVNVAATVLLSIGFLNGMKAL